MKFILTLSMLLSLISCARDADVASRNLSFEADNFQLQRRVVFYNGITSQYILSIEGVVFYKRI